MANPAGISWALQQISDRGWTPPDATARGCRPAAAKVLSRAWRAVRGGRRRLDSRRAGDYRP